MNCFENIKKTVTPPPFAYTPIHDTAPEIFTRIALKEYSVILTTMAGPHLGPVMPVILMVTSVFDGKK